MQQGMEKSSNTRQSFGRLAILIAVAAIDLLGATMVFPQIPFYAKHFNSSAHSSASFSRRFFSRSFFPRPYGVASRTVTDAGLRC
jgi:hypothetical protein